MSGKCNLLLSILYYLLPYLVWKTVPHRAKHPCQSNESVFEKKLSCETNTDYKDITDFLTEEPVKVNGHAPEKLCFALFQWKNERGMLRNMYHKGTIKTNY